jgi:hypothetical protein
MMSVWPFSGTLNEHPSAAGRYDPTCQFVLASGSALASDAFLVQVFLNVPPTTTLLTSGDGHRFLLWIEQRCEKDKLPTIVAKAQKMRSRSE